MCKKKTYRLCNVKRLEQDIKSGCNSHFLWNAWKLKCSSIRVTCKCDQYDSAFCAFQLKALINPSWCFLLYCCACLHPIAILREAGRTTAPWPATNLSILISKSSARTEQNVISVALETPLEIRLRICLYKMSLLYRPDDYVGFTPSCPSTFTTKLRPCI